MEGCETETIVRKEEENKKEETSIMLYFDVNEIVLREIFKHAKRDVQYIHIYVVHFEITTSAFLAMFVIFWLPWISNCFKFLLSLSEASHKIITLPEEVTDQ